jgi:hypothetical protein
VSHHFIHYSTATKGILQTYRDEGSKWVKRYQERAPSEIFTDETSQAVMVHTKSINAEATNRFKKRCRYDATKKFEECWVASPWPGGEQSSTVTYDQATGLNYNCFVNTKVEDYWVPLLKEALANRQVSLRVGRT